MKSVQLSTDNVAKSYSTDPVNFEFNFNLLMQNTNFARGFGRRFKLLVA